MLTRRTFISRVIPGVLAASYLPHLARAASGPGGVANGKVLTNTTVGPVWLIKKDGQVVGIEPLVQDGFPTDLIKAMPDRLYNRARVKAPMVRKDFLAKREKSDRSLRGNGDFVEVSWDDATKLVADEMKRVKERYGNVSLQRGKSGWGTSHTHVHRTEPMLQRFLNGFGGSSTFFGNYSIQAVSEILGTVAWGGPFATSDWPSIKSNAKLMVVWGANPLATTQILSGRYTTRAWAELKNSSVEVIAITPNRNETVRKLGCRWVPIYPNTDVALALGMMHTLYSENLYDKKFISQCTHGFDSFVPYLTGAKDGTPKSAEWASKICGVPANTIRELARKMAGARTTIASGWSTQRQHHGEQPPWALVTLGAMLGHMGLPGGGVTFGLVFSDHGFPQPQMPAIGGLSTGKNPVSDTFPIACLSDAWLNPGKTVPCKGVNYKYPDTKLLYTAGGGQVTHHQNTNRLLKAMQSLETIIVQDPWWTPTARFADIVLPASSDLERDDIGQVLNLIFTSRAAVAPQFKSRSDYEILTEISDRLGFKQAFTEGKSINDWCRHFYDTAKSQAKIAMPSFDEFWAKDTIIEFPQGKGDFVHLADFRKDPLLNPLGTSTGLIEITSPAVAKLNYDDCPPHPTWLEPVEWRGSAAAAKYPLQMISSHPIGRLHSQLDNTNIRKNYKVADREPVHINTKDASKRGIRSGDVVRLFNGRGQVLAGAVVTDDIMPGVVLLHEGAWYDPDQPGKPGALDKQGSPNPLTLDDPLTSKFAQATIAGTAIVQVEKYAKAAPVVTAYDQPS